MKLIYEGKTKDVYKIDGGNFLLKFKDDVTGSDGVFDPGANSVGLSIPGAGIGGLKLSTYFFEKLKHCGIPTHYIGSNIDNAQMTVRPADKFCDDGLEVICRLRAVGSFYRRYGGYIQEGATLDYFVEFTLKDDEREDPPISKDALAMLGILSESDYNSLKSLTKKITGIVNDELKNKGLELYDIKFEFGKADGEIILIDEISGGNMRVFKDGKPVAPLELVELML